MLNLIAYIIIPAYTILFVKGIRVVLQRIFSVIGNYLHRKDAFVLWGVLVGAYFYYSLRTAIRLMETETKRNLPGSLFTLSCFLCHHYPLSAGGDAV